MAGAIDASASINDAPDVIIAMQPANPHLQGLWVASWAIAAMQPGIADMSMCDIDAMSVCSIGGAKACAGRWAARPSATQNSSKKVARRFTRAHCEPPPKVSIDARLR